MKLPKPAMSHLLWLTILGAVIEVLTTVYDALQAAYGQGGGP